MGMVGERVRGSYGFGKKKGVNMERNAILLVNMAFFLFSSISLAQVPQQVAGFTLGRDIANYAEMVEMDTALPIRHMEYLKEVEIKETEGFKSGLIWYGTCARPGQIVRIKLKYADSTKEFYNKLLERVKERFGEPGEWRGDAFHVVIAWKWSFTDSENNHISMILQHNTKDEEEKRGNAVKLTVWNSIEEERLCFEKKYPKLQEKPRGPSHGKRGRGPVNWERFVPR
ncbi:MAG: hypothetical protein GTO13_00355 [Proteobacteria bacterium]|nr:hypothetical protein [Pseudomonadota bacterium]